jgi:signal transduction histidine kinase/ligand-binding sensor domain-containing protein
MSLKRRWLQVTAALLGLAPMCRAQVGLNWRVYKLADHLPESACIAVTVSPQGLVLARHYNLPGLTELDGYNVARLASPETGKNRVYQSAGGQLWTVAPEGLAELKEDGWVAHRVAGIAAQLQVLRGSVIDPIPLKPVRQGLVLCLLTNELLEVSFENPDQPRTEVLRLASRTGLKSFLGLTIARDGGLWISGERGLAKVPAPVRSLRPETEWQEFAWPEELPLVNLESPHEDPAGGVVGVGHCTTNEERLITYFDGQKWSVRSAGGKKVREAWVDADSSGWAMAIDSLIRWELNRPELSECDEVSARQYFDVALEAGGNFWLATSEGLLRHAAAIWRTPPAARGIGGGIPCLTSDTENRLWFAVPGRLATLDNGQLKHFPLPMTGNGPLQPRLLFTLKSGSLLLAAGEAEAGSAEELFIFHTGQEVFRRVGDSGQQLKLLGEISEGNVCVQRLKTDGNGGQWDLERFDGRRFETIGEVPDPAAIGTNLYAAFGTQSGELWLSGSLGLAWFHEKGWRIFSSADKSNPEGVLTFLELPEGKLWCGTADQIWEFDGRNWSAVRGGFDRINALGRTRDGSVWVATNNGLHRQFHGAWVENGIEEGLPTPAVRSICTDQRGRLWAGTARGLSLFHPEADRDPPQSLIRPLSERGNTAPEGGFVTVNFSGQDKWKYTPRDRLLYSYRLDGHDWSPFQELTRAPFTDLPSGKHYFEVRAMDRNCNIETEAARLEFSVVLPWYRETRLVLIASAGAAGALFFAAIAFNRHRQLARSYAAVEQKVAERTRQLEVAGRELLHSQKMNALGTLAAGIAHDFNNILSIIKGSAQIIEDNLDNPEKVRVRADRIRTVVEQGAGIVQAMLGFSRESEVEPGPCDINGVVQETLKLLGDRFLHQIQVRFEPGEGLPAVLAPKDFIQQILLNFIFNAAESMMDEKVILLHTWNQACPLGQMVLAPEVAEKYVAVAVQDFGCGVPPENLGRIFEPFFTTKAMSTRHGTGLGLSMVYELARKLGAGLAVESVVAKGSTFTLILPVKQMPQTAKP